MNSLYNAKGEIIPSIGLGTFPFQGRTMADMVKEAVKIGYRLFDTADDYRGEPGIGIAVSELVAEGICEREDLFLQTKISANGSCANEPLTGVYFNPDSNFMKRHTVEEVVREKVSISLRDMNTSYLDSLLIHLPYPGYSVDIWRTMIDLKNEGIVKHIGVSNYHERHIDELLSETGVCPEINEIYLSPIATKQTLVDYCKDKDILIHAYSPLMDLSANRLDCEVVRPIAQKYNKTIAQIILRWNLERGCLPLPKTKTPSRLRENFDIFDFELTAKEVDTIFSLNRDYQHVVESKSCPGL